MTGPTPLRVGVDAVSKVVTGDRPVVDDRPRNADSLGGGIAP